MSVVYLAVVADGPDHVLGHGRAQSQALPGRTRPSSPNIRSMAVSPGDRRRDRVGGYAVRLGVDEYRHDGLHDVVPLLVAVGDHRAEGLLGDGAGEDDVVVWVVESGPCADQPGAVGGEDVALFAQVRLGGGDVVREGSIQ